MTTSPDLHAALALPALGRASPPAADGPLALPALRAPDPAPAPSAADLALARGRREGRDEGAAEAREELRPVIEGLLRIAEHLQDLRDQALHEAEADLEALALAVARRLVQRELEADPGIVRRLVARALELLPVDAPIEIRAHPGDLETLAPALEAWSAGRALRWTPDPALDRGSFVAETPRRVVDGRTDVALRTLYDRLRED